MEDYRYIVFFSLKDENGVVNDHPLRPFQLEVEAQWWLEGYVDSIINHTDETDPLKVKGNFRISRIDDNDSDVEAKTIGTENE